MYLYIKALHISFIIAWMAGLLYMPRLFVYHTTTTPGSELYNTLLIMERKLYYWIMLPSISGSFCFGLILIYLNGGFENFGLWLHIKLTLVIMLMCLHVSMGKHYYNFLLNKNRHSGFYFKVLNEIPAVLMLAIVFLAVCKPV